MSLLSSVYGVGVRFRNQLYEKQVLHNRRLSGPVASVGSLSAGGAGKTPFVLCLGELLKQRGIPFDVLSRGYGRRTSGVARVDPSGSAVQFGDEPLLIARRLGVPVVVGESRFEAGTFAERELGRQMHLLDDGFQHRALARDFDIVLLTPEDVMDRLLPGGRLREPISSLARADVVVWSGDTVSPLPQIEGKIAWRITREIATDNVPPRAVAFCGIARPRNLFDQLRASGSHLVAEQAYRDHHHYTERDVDHLLELRRRSGADGFVTTEKDAVNLGNLIARLDPVAVVALKFHLEDAANAVDTMLQTIGERKQKA